MDERELLKRYAETADEKAFAQVVDRYGSWLFSAARRQLGDEHLAEDVTQAVFMMVMRRARRLGRYRYVGGWMFLALGYCVKRAKRVRARVARREKEAAGMRKEVVEEVRWEEVAPELEEAVGKLGKADRDVVLLRFYEQRPLAEVGKALGISDEAARKRVERAVGKLRGILEEKGVRGTTAGLSAVLVGNVVGEMPASLVEKIVLAVGSGGGSTVAAGIAKGAMKMMAVAKVKLAAVVIVVGVAGVGAGVVSRSATAPSAGRGAAPASAPAAIALEEDESKVAGKIQLVRWDLVLNEEGEKLVREILVPFATPSKGFEGYRCRGSDLRNVVAEAFAAGGVERVGIDMSHSNGNDDQVHIVGPWGNTLVSKPNTTVGMKFGSNEFETHTRTAANHIRLTLKHDIPSVGINELTNGWQWTEYPAGAIACDAELAAGDAVAFVAGYAGASGRKYYGLVVWETYCCTDVEQGRIVAIRDARWWCRNGPAKVRQWSNIASVWKAQGSESKPADLKPFTITLDDGKTARLAALTNPSRWPFCWWDPAGNPTTEYNGMVSFFGGDPPKGLSAILLIDGAGQEYIIADPIGQPHLNPGGSRYTNIVSLQIPDADAAKKQYETGILVGPWSEIARMKADDSVTVGETTYQTYRASSFDEASFLVHFDIIGPRRDADVLVAVAGNKQAWRRYVSLASPQPNEVTLSDQPNFHGIPLSEVEYFRVMRRKRQYVTFGGFAMEPKLLPPVAATTEQSRSAEKRIAKRAEQQRLQQILDSRKAWQQTAPDPATPQGALRALANAILSKDRAAAEGLLLASSPESKAVGKEVVEYMITRQEMYALVARRFGEAAIHQQLGDVVHIDDDWHDARFTDLADGSVEVGGLVLRKIPGGEYRLDMDHCARAYGGELAPHLSAIKRIPEMLSSNPDLTVADLRAALRRPATTQP